MLPPSDGRRVTHVGTRARNLERRFQTSGEDTWGIVALTEHNAGNGSQTQTRSGQAQVTLIGNIPSGDFIEATVFNFLPDARNFALLSALVLRGDGASAWYEGNYVTVPGSGSANVTFDTHIGGATLLNLTSPGNPTVTATDTYIFVITITPAL